MIVGSFYPNSLPLVEAVLYFPRLHKGSRVLLLVDTGTSDTLIHPADARRILGLDDFEQDFEDRPRESMKGIGGEAQVWPEDAVITFRWHSKPRAGRERGSKEEEEIKQTIRIAIPTHHNEEAYSLLGRDLIHRFELLYSFPTGKLTITQP